MAGATKIIIITSDEDVIRQFALHNNNENTHILNLDKNKQIIPTTEDNNNMINLDFLVHLSAVVRI